MQSLLEPSVLEKHNLEDTTGNCVKQISSVRKFLLSTLGETGQLCGGMQCPLLQLVLASVHREISSFFCLVLNAGLFTVV